VKRGVLWTLIAVVLLGSVGALVAIDYTTWISSPVSSKEPEQVKVVINKGDTLNTVLTVLEEKGIITSPLYFKAYLFVNGLDAQVKAGVYYVSTDRTPEEVAAMLVAGPKTPYHILRVTEGANLWQAAAAFEEAGIAGADEVLALARDFEFLRAAGLPLAAPRAGQWNYLEGYLFPETYYIAPGHDAKSTIRRMIRQTVQELKKAQKKHIKPYSRLLEQTGLTDYELVILASLVEREAPLPHEKRLVASVFLNRLKKGMMLQTDPTLTYTPAKRGAAPTAEDRKDQQNPYNTYVIPALPPGPICNPGRDALEAVVNPASTGFYFFVAKDDGSRGHYFSTDYEEHKRAVLKYQRKTPDAPAPAPW
jgi:UPF0755 protein